MGTLGPWLKGRTEAGRGAEDSVELNKSNLKSIIYKSNYLYMIMQLKVYIIL